MEIAIKSIIPAPWNPRAAITAESVASLAETIKVDGLIQPISVIANPDGDGYICYDGNRRLAACKSLKRKTIEVNVGEITTYEAKVRTITANLQRKDSDPLLAADVIASLTAEGKNVEVIASKIGRPTSWVRRRARLIKLSQSVREFADKLAIEAMERLAELDEDRQMKMSGEIAKRLKWNGGNTITWRDLRHVADGLVFDLDAAEFDCGKCRACSERTGADWFADDATGLGRCLDGKCYKAKIKAHRVKLVEENIPADAEREEVSSEWQMPWEARQDSNPKRNKKHPCAYYWFDREGIHVKWAASAKMIEAAAEAERQRKAEEAKRDEADRKRSESIVERLEKTFAEDESERDERVLAEVGKLINRDACDENTEAWLESAIINALCNWHDRGEWAEMLANVPFVRRLAGISEEDCAWFVEQNSEVED